MHCQALTRRFINYNSLYYDNASIVYALHDNRPAIIRVCLGFIRSDKNEHYACYKSLFIVNVVH